MEHYSGQDVIGEVFNQLFATAKVEVFKLGVRESYVGEDNSQSWRAWERGDYDESAELFGQNKRYQEWIDLCLSSPAEVIRGQIVVEPLHTYLQWSLLCVFHQYQLRGAERVYTYSGDLAKASGTPLPTSDFLIFDRTKVLQWECDATGKVIGGWTWDMAKGDKIDTFLKLRDVFMQVAQPIE